MPEINFDDKKWRERKGKKPDLFLVLDCETATLPFTRNMTPEEKKVVAIAKPLIYDLGWQVIDRKGEIYSQHSILIQETFFVPNVFNTAYYSEKRPLYLQQIENNTIEVMLWRDAIALLENDLQYIKYTAAYNAMFDFCKAIPFTEKYIRKLYSSDYNHWEKKQYFHAQDLLQKRKYEKKTSFDKYSFSLRGKKYPMIDIWGIACEVLINTEKYKRFCISNNYITASGRFFTTSAEVVFRFIQKDIAFIEDHTAWSDASIESIILTKALRKSSVIEGIIYFPFKILGEVTLRKEA